MNNGNEGSDVLGDSQQRYRCPWAEIGKYGPRKEPIRLQDSLPSPLKKNRFFFLEYSRPRAQFFPIRTFRLANNV